MSNSDLPRNDAVLANAAILYYKDGLTQGEIARRMGVSRATVINYLRLAREQNIVVIRINGASFTTSTLSRELRDRFDLKDAYVADYPEKPARNGREAESASNRHVARVGAQALRDIVSPGDVLGVAWGETIHFLAEELSPSSVPDLVVCQMVGSMKSPLFSAAETCTIRIAGSFGAECNTLHAPAVLSSAQLAEALRAEPVIASQLKRLARVSSALFSVGHCGPTTHVAQASIVSRAEIASYRKRGAVGILCGRFIDADGRHIEGDMDQRMIGIGLRELKKLRCGILVAGGLHKHDAIRATLVGGYTTHLVTDADTARALLDS